MIKAMTRMDPEAVEIFPRGVLDLEEADASLERVNGNTIVLEEGMLGRNGDRDYGNMRVFCKNGERMRADGLKSNRDGISFKKIIFDNLSDGVASNVIKAMLHGSGVDDLEDLFSEGPEELSLQEES
jgi:hypothetical protein